MFHHVKATISGQDGWLVEEVILRNYFWTLWRTLFGFDLFLDFEKTLLHSLNLFDGKILATDFSNTKSKYERL